MMPGMTADRLTAVDIRAALRRSYGVTASDLVAEEWALVDEVRPIGAWSGRGSTIDMLAVRAWRGRLGNERHAIEIKVDRGDFRREMESEKWRLWAGLCHRFIFATPAGLVDITDIPAGTGWVEVTPNGCRTTVVAPLNPDPGPFPDDVAVELARRASRMAEKIRRAEVTGSPEAIALYRDDLTRLNAAHAAMKRRHRDAVRRANDLERLLAHSVVVECVVCTTRVLPHPFRPDEWRHVTGDGLVPERPFIPPVDDHPATPPDEYRMTTAEGATA